MITLSPTAKEELISILFPKPEDCYITFHRVVSWPDDSTPNQLVAWAKCKVLGRQLYLVNLDQFLDVSPQGMHIYSSGRLICKQYRHSWPANLRLVFPFTMNIL